MRRSTQRDSRRCGRRRRLGGRRPVPHRRRATPAGGSLRRRSSPPTDWSRRPSCSAGTTCATRRCTATSPGRSSSSIGSAESPRGSLLDVLTWGHLWVDLYHMLMSPSPLFLVRAPPASTSCCCSSPSASSSWQSAVAPAMSFDAVSMASSPGRPSDCASSSSSSSIVTVAQHVSGGGSRYARYLLPAVGVAAALFALGLDRLWPRVLPAVTVVLMGWWAVRNVPSGVDPTAERRPRDRGQPMPELLQVLPASPWLRTAAAVVIAVGCVAIAISLVDAATRRVRRE